jgi:hypothetical protein
MGYLIITLFILSSFTQLAFSGELDMIDEEYPYHDESLKFSITPKANIVSNDSSNLVSSSIKDNYPECAIECFHNLSSCSLFTFDSNASTCNIYSGTSFTVQSTENFTTGFFVGTY